MLMATPTIDRTSTRQLCLNSVKSMLAKPMGEPMDHALHKNLDGQPLSPTIRP